MRAFVVTDYAHPSKIPLTQDVPTPKVGRGQVLVDVYSAGLNYFDVRVIPSFSLTPSSSQPRPLCAPISAASQILQSQGKYQHQPPRPFVLGSELAGRIAEGSPIPEGCPFRPGDRVFGAAQGAFA